MMLLSDTATKESSSTPKPALLMSLLILLDPQQGAADTEWAESPQRVESVLAPLVCSLSVLHPVQFVVQVYSQYRYL